MPAKKRSNPLEQIKKITSNAEAPQSILVLSPDQIRIDRALDMICKHFGLKDDTKWLYDFKKIKISDASEKELKSIAFKSKEISLFSSKKIVLFDQIEKTTAAKTAILLELLEDTNPDVTYIFQGSTLRSDSKLYKHHKSSEAIVNLDPFSAAELLRWIRKEFSNNGLTAENGVAELITEISEESADNALKIIELLSLYTNESKITVTDLEDLLPTQISINEFKWLENVHSGKLANAECSLHQIVKSGKNTLQLLGLIYNNYINYYLIALLREQGHSQSEIKKKLGLTPWLFNKHWNNAQRLKPEDLESKLIEILRTDGKLKNRSLNEEILFSSLVTKLAA